MNQRQTAASKKGFYAALGGTVVVAICCFTPILVITLGILGLSAFTPYLDYVLFPALVVLIVLTVVSYARWGRSSPPAKSNINQ